MCFGVLHKRVHMTMRICAWVYIYMCIAWSCALRVRVCWLIRPQCAYDDVYMLFICAWVYIYMCLCIYLHCIAWCRALRVRAVCTWRCVYIIYLCLSTHLHLYCLVLCTTSKHVSRLIRPQALLVSKQGLNYDYTTVRLWRDGSVLGWCISG